MVCRRRGATLVDLCRGLNIVKLAWLRLGLGSLNIDTQAVAHDMARKKVAEAQERGKDLEIKDAMRSTVAELLNKETIPLEEVQASHIVPTKSLADVQNHIRPYLTKMNFMAKYIALLPVEELYGHAVYSQ